MLTVLEVLRESVAVLGMALTGFGGFTGLPNLSVNRQQLGSCTRSFCTRTYLHYNTLYYITLRYVTLRYVTLHYKHRGIYKRIYAYLCLYINA